MCQGLSYFRFLHHIVLVQLATSSMRGNSIMLKQFCLNTAVLKEMILEKGNSLAKYLEENHGFWLTFYFKYFLHVTFGKNVSRTVEVF